MLCENTEIYLLKYVYLFSKNALFQKEMVPSE